MSEPQTPESRSPTFEETYPRYEFSELVRISLAIADWLARRRRVRSEPHPPAETEPPRDPGTAAPAT